MLPYHVCDYAMVDGEKWYSIECNNTVSGWIANQSPNQWYHRKENYFRCLYDIHNELYMLLRLKYG